MTRAHNIPHGVKGLLDEENYSMLSVKYRTEQQQLDETVKTISVKLEETKEKTDDAKRWIDLIQNYSAIDELTAPLLNELIEKIVVHQSWKDRNGKTVRDIEIYYRFVGKIDEIGMGNVPIVALPRNTVFNSCKAGITLSPALHYPPKWNSR